jgi:hypothetical protein
MAEIVYIMCAVMSIACTLMLMRGYRMSKSHLLLWSSFCFAGLAFSNLVLFVDMVILPQVNIGGMFWRNFLSAISGSLLLFGLIWELT